jgi:hypothetical protein
MSAQQDAEKKVALSIVKFDNLSFAIATISIAPLLRPQVARLRRKLEDALL